MRSSRVLIVEDEAAAYNEIAKSLQNLGYETVGRATSAEQCLKLVELQHPDLVLMGVPIQGFMDGITAAGVIRSRFRLPVIILATEAEEATSRHAQYAEAFTVIPKAVGRRELKSAIETALYKHRVQQEIRRLNRLYDMLYQVRESFVRGPSPEEMLAEVCRIMVDCGGADLAWIGWLDPATMQITPAAHFGEPGEMLSAVKYYAVDEPRKQGGPGRAFLEGKPAVCNDCGAGLCPFPTAEAPAGFGYRSCASFPLKFQGRSRGVLSVCTAEADFFGEREIQIFELIAIDISFSLEKLEGDAQRERVERSLWESNERLAAFFQHARDAILIADPESGIILEANEQAEILLGRPRSEIVGLHFTHIHPPEIAVRCQEAFSEHSVSGPWRQVESEILRPDGSRVSVEVSGGLIDLGNGQSVVQGLFRDITERKAAQAEADRQRETWMKVFESAPFIMMIVDREIRVRNINCTGVNFSNRPKEDLLHLLCGGVFDCLNSFEGGGCGTNAPCRDCVLRNTVVGTFKTGDSVFDAEGRMILRKGGREVPVDLLISTALIQDEDTDVVLVSIADITERRMAEQEKERLEMQLREAQKLEAIGTLAGGIAHDFNNILAPIIGYTEIALSEMPLLDPQRELLEHVLKAAHRARELVRQILAFSRHGQEKPMIPVNIGSIVKEALKLLRASLPATIVIEQDVERGTAVADAIQIHQVVVNLCTNAAHAMAGGGTLRVSLKKVDLRKEELKSFKVPEMGPGSYLELSVADSGHGMDHETIQHIFEPYFTTKKPGKGTGLGLSVVHGIVTRHGGRIFVGSDPGKGSIFTVYLPSAEDKPQSSMAIVESLPGGSERILFVDDEEMVTQMAAKMLTRLGYDVTSQTSPVDALNSFRSHPQAFDLIISDFTMPGMTGVDLAREIKKDRWDVPIIICTGFNERLADENIRDLGITEIVLKPLDRTQFAELVRRVLDAKKQ